MRLFLLSLALAASASGQIVVNSTADTDADDGACTLREAIESANLDAASGTLAGECAQGNGADTIRLAVPTGSTITLTAALPTVTESLTIEGTGDASDVAIDGDGQFRVLNFGGDGQTYALRRLTVSEGQAQFGGGIQFGGANTCTVEDAAILDNTVTNFGGGILVGRGMTCVLDRLLVSGNESVGVGGGVLASQSSVVTLRNSTITGNSAGSGGGVAAFYNVVIGDQTGAFVLDQSTISGNTTTGRGGGLWFTGPEGTLTIRSSAIVDNATVGDLGFSGGASLNGTATITSTIIAGNRTERSEPEYTDLSASNGAVSGGNNVIGIESFGTEFSPGLPNANRDFVGDENAPFDAELAALANYGGRLPTHLPLSGSPVIDAGVCPDLDADQRNGLREIDDPAVADVSGDACDIGPVEGTVSFVATEAEEVSGLQLYAPFPNPARGTVQMVYESETTGAVSLTVVDVLGRDVAVLVEGVRPSGSHRATLDTASLAPGTYLVRLAGPMGTVTRALTVVR